VPADALGELKVRAKPGELDKVADQARALREWFRRFVHKHMGRPLPPKALQELGPLNKLLQGDETFTQISSHHERDGDHFELRAMRRWRSLNLYCRRLAEHWRSSCVKKISPA
jgi:hypothetical protein